jgi:hypothetical protein
VLLEGAIIIKKDEEVEMVGAVAAKQRTDAHIAHLQPSCRNI